jgi:hypothetical protein
VTPLRQIGAIQFRRLLFVRSGITPSISPLCHNTHSHTIPLGQNINDVCAAINVPQPLLTISDPLLASVLLTFMFEVRTQPVYGPIYFSFGLRSSVWTLGLWSGFGIMQLARRQQAKCLDAEHQGEALPSSQGIVIS